MEFVLKINNKNGIHLKPATLLAKIALSYPNITVTLEKDGKTADAKSIMSILSLEAVYQSEVTIRLEGDNIEDCRAKIDSLINQNLL